MKTVQEYVDVLAKKSAEASNPNDAVAFSQAALNLAHAIAMLSTVAEGDE